MKCHATATSGSDDPTKATLARSARGVGGEMAKALGVNYIRPKIQAEMCASADRTVFM